MVSTKTSSKSKATNASTKSNPKSSSSAPFGQPSNKKQSSRKSKASWRKNIDLTQTEQSLENERISQRIGLPIISKNDSNSSLFIEDRKGDSNKSDKELGLTKKSKKKPLKSLEILSQKSAVPAFSNKSQRAGVDNLTKKTTIGSVNDKLKKSGMSKKMRDRLIRLSGKNVKGPFGIVVEGRKQEEDLKDRLNAVGEATFDPWNLEIDEAAKGKQTEKEWLDDVRNRQVKVSEGLRLDELKKKMEPGREVGVDLRAEKKEGASRSEELEGGGTDRVPFHPITKSFMQV